jgi:oligopeptide/dipeptide ABC transporter ATP-binding protein
MTSRQSMSPVVPHVEIDRLTIEFGIRQSFLRSWMGQHQVAFRAVDNVSLTIGRGETVGLVGESGSGKTTIGRTLLGLNPVTSGILRLDGRDMASLTVAEAKSLPRKMQMVFQDPYGSLNPRLSVAAALAEVLRFHNIVAPSQISGEVLRLLALVGLSSSLGGRRPRDLSGGQRQRIGLARALAVRPTFLVLDEPVAALDVSIQAQILNLLQDLRCELGLTMLLIAHELSVVRHLSDRVAVMYLGSIMETGTANEVFERPRHPYTQSLLRSMPRLVAEKRHRPPVIAGDPESGSSVPQVRLTITHIAACHFAQS